MCFSVALFRVKVLLSRDDLVPNRFIGVERITEVLDNLGVGGRGSFDNSDSSCKRDVLDPSGRLGRYFVRVVCMSVRGWVCVSPPIS